MALLNGILSELIHIDTLCLVMALLASFIGMNIYRFARHYLEGDAYQAKFLRNTALLTISICIMSAADNLYLLWITWVTNTLLLRDMMKHKESWQAANNASLLTLTTLTIGIVSLFAACVLLTLSYGSYSINTITASSIPLQGTTYIALLCIIITAMTQSAIWPFQRWMISSLNSPTPVSAMMHAGLVNGGGFLLARFSALLVQSDSLLIGLFITGLITALLGATWKLIQPDVKRMLACSTTSQMGYMIMQCGLGLFPAAIAHLFWHAMFKSFLFLNQNQIGKKAEPHVQKEISASSWLCAIITGCISIIIFDCINTLPWISHHSIALIQIILFVTALHTYLNLEINSQIKTRVITIGLITIFAALYASSFHLFDILFRNSIPMHARPLNSIYVIGIALLIVSWLVKINHFKWLPPSLFNKLYVSALNSSQADPHTITTCRNDYHYQEKTHA